MGGLFNKKTSTSTSATGPDAATKARYDATMSRADTVSQAPYTPYTGQRVAGFNQDQSNAFQSVRDTQGIGQPFMQQAQSYASQGAAPITTQGILSQYNPYIDAQVDATQRDFNVQNQREMQNVNSNAAKIGALTGDRSQVAQALSQESQRRQQDPIIAGIRSQGFDDTARIAESNRQGAFQGASQFTNMGQTAQNLAAADQQRLLGVGGLEQQLDQANLDVPYQEHLNQQAFPYQSTQWLAGIQGALGPLMGSTSTQTTPRASTGSQILGLAATGLGAYMASDARLKENIERVGELDDGTPIYRYNFVGDPTTQIGVIAQEIEQTNPAAVATDEHGIKHVDYDVATRPALKAAGGLGEPPPAAGVGPGLHPPMEPQMAAGGVAGGLGEGVDPDFARMTGNLTHMVGALRAQNAPQPGFADGGAVSPVPLQVPQLPSSSVKSQSYVPQTQVSPSQMPVAQVASQGGSGDSGLGGLSSLASSFGKYMGSPTQGLNSNASWLSGIEYKDKYWADGGRVGMANGGPANDTGPSEPFGFGVADSPGATSTPSITPYTSPRAPAAGTPAPFKFDAGSLPGSIVDAPTDIRPVNITEGRPYEPQNVQKPDRSVGTPALPPTAQAYGPAQPDDSASLPWLSGGSGSETMKGGDSTNSKEWYEYGSNPNVGAALMAAGLATMGGDSPDGIINIGRGGLSGLNVYLAQKNAEREAASKREDRKRQAEELAIKAAREAEIERYNRAKETRDEKRLTETERKNRETDERNSPAALEERKRRSERVEGEEKLRATELAKAREAEEVARMVESSRYEIRDKDGNNLVDPALFGYVSGSSANNALVSTLPEWMTNATGAISDKITGQNTGGTPTERLRQRKVVNSRLQEIQAAITTAANKGQGAVSDTERQMYSQAVAAVQDGDIEVAIKVMDDIAKRLSERAAALRKPYAEKKKRTGKPLRVEDGHAFYGGDEGDPANWERIE